jgi:hypothetical protein
MQATTARHGRCRNGAGMPSLKFDRTVHHIVLEDCIAAIEAAMRRRDRLQGHVEGALPGWSRAPEKTVKFDFRMRSGEDGIDRSGQAFPPVRQTNAKNVVQTGAIQARICRTFRRCWPVGRSDRIDRWHLNPMATCFLERCGRNSWQWRRRPRQCAG